jgi:CDP-glucose 4,6-dehydratase
MNLQDYYKGKKVLVTGHTGFKGSWMCFWLKELGAQVIGISLPPPSDRPNLFRAAQIAEGMESEFCDICDAEKLRHLVQQYQPELVFHLAAQSLVRPSYKDPITTYTTNVIGTVNLLEAARACPSVRSVVVITTDKCYQNNEWYWGYREMTV